jgi:hypothetical protein
MGENFIELLQARHQRIIENGVIREDLASEKQRNEQQNGLSERASDSHGQFLVILTECC